MYENLHRDGTQDPQPVKMTSSLDSPAQATVSIGYWHLSTGPCLRAVPLLFLVVVSQVCEGFSQSHEELKAE